MFLKISLKMSVSRDLPEHGERFYDSKILECIGYGVSEVMDDSPVIFQMTELGPRN